MAIVRHAQLAFKQPTDAMDTLIETETFSSHGKMQPFTLSASSSALLLLDLHTHLCADVVCGYLAGHWDVNTHNLAITHAFPCLTKPENAQEQSDEDDMEDLEKRMAKMEFEIYNTIYSKHLTLVGWYRSAPNIPRSLPSLRDCESQLDYQVKLLGNSDASYTPCVGLIVKPFASLQNESDLCFYWVLPPPENSPQEYGKPMRMSHSVVQDPCLSQDCLEQLDGIIEYYKENHPKSMVKLHENFNSDTSFVTKMGRSLLPKFPRDQDERLWRYIRMKILGEKNSDLSDPLTASNLNLSTNNGSVNGHKVEDEDEDEEEIDDDEENALSARRASTNGVSSMTSTVAPTDQVISMLLQKQSPVAPMAHGASGSAKPSTSSDHEDEAPLDFSKQQDDNVED